MVLLRVQVHLARHTFRGLTIELAPSSIKKKKPGACVRRGCPSHFSGVNHRTRPEFDTGALLPRTGAASPWMSLVLSWLSLRVACGPRW